MSPFLAITFVFLLGGAIILSFKTRFVQFTSIPLMTKLFFSSLFSKKATGSDYTIKAHRALFTTMATSLGIGNIVAPIIAIGFGGPGALLGFILATIFGSATVFTEVSFALAYRKKLPNGKIMGGPMQYLKEGIHPIFALIYAVSCFIMLVSWSGKQTNTLATLLTEYNIPTYLTGILVAIIVSLILTRGIKLIGKLAGKLVPFMLLLYLGSMLWIIALHINRLPHVITLIFQSAFTPQALLGAGVGVGLLNALQWGLSEATFANEAGVGTITIPHSMAATKSPVDQGVLSMISVYTNGVLCLISGVAVLISDAWLAPRAEFGITMLAQMFYQHFAILGSIILLISVLLIALTTIVGNSYNGSQCFLYVTKNRWLRWYYALIAIAIFFCAIIDVKTLWSLGGYFIVPVAVPNIIGIVILAFKKKDYLRIP